MWPNNLQTKRKKIWVAVELSYFQPFIWKHNKVFDFQCFSAPKTLKKGSMELNY